MKVINDTLALNSVEVKEQAVDMSAAFTLDPMWAAHSMSFSIQLVFSGAPMGSFKLQVSNDPGVSTRGEGFYDLRNLGNWSDVECSNQVIAEAGDHTWNFENPGFRWCRVVWEPTMGSGSLEVATYNAKGV